ncbi:Maf family protein [soil metagenome]
MTTRLILASASPARLQLLRAAGIATEVIVSGVDEDAFSGPDAATRCVATATAKARAVSAGVDDGLVLGCDSLLDLDGEALGKPPSAAEALTRWRRMAGRAGTLHTGHCLIDAGTGREETDLASTVVHFGTPTEAELAAYVGSGEPLRVAGGFTIDGLGGPFIDGVEGDPGAVIGLSLPLLRRLLGRFGLPISALWAAL